MSNTQGNTHPIRHKTQPADLFRVSRKASCELNSYRPSRSIPSCSLEVPQGPITCLPLAATSAHHDPNFKPGDPSQPHDAAQRGGLHEKISMTDVHERLPRLDS